MHNVSTAWVCVGICLHLIRHAYVMHRNTSGRRSYFANFSKSIMLLQNSSVVSLELINQDIILKINGCNWISINSPKKKITPKSGTDKRCKLWSTQFTLGLQWLDWFRENTRSYLAVFAPNIMNHKRCGREVGRSVLERGVGWAWMCVRGQSHALVDRSTRV